MGTFLRVRLHLFLLLTIGAGWSSASASQGEAYFYFAYGTSDAAVIEGRLLNAKNPALPAAGDSARKNMHRNVQHFFTDELKKHPFELQLGETRWELHSDKEGYFLLRVAPPQGIANGWHEIKAQGEGVSGKGRLLLVPPHNTRGIISDLDDTLMISEVTRTHSLLGNTFLKNPLQREAVAGVAALYRQVTQQNPEPESTALFYLSASPRQLHGNISDFLALNHFPPGVLITRKIGIDKDSDPLIDSFTYKTGKIEQILHSLPNTNFILVGDDGEKDPEVYDWIQQRYPDRVEAVWIRRVHPDSARKRFVNQLDLEAVLNSRM